MWIRLVLLGTCLLCGCQAATTQYDGFRVFSLTPQTKEQLEHIDNFLDQHPEIDVWSEPKSVGLPVQVMVPAGEPPRMLAELAELGVPHELHIPDVQKEINAQHILNEMGRRMSSHMFEYYQDFSKIIDWVDYKAEQCGPLCELMDIGSSFEGRPLRVIKIGAPTDSPKESIWIDAGIHAREWIAPATALYIIERLIDNYHEDIIVYDLLNAYDIYVLPVVNPDGYVYTWTTNRTWRKTRSFNSSDDECVGVDANRNFDFKWQTIGSSSDPCSNTYAGPFPLSEPEARAQSDFILAHERPWRVYLSLHSFGQLLMAPWGYKSDPPPDYDKMMRAGRVAVNEIERLYGTKYTLGSASNILYRSSGTSRDWAKGKAEIEYVFTAELRDKGDYAFLLPPEQILPTARETYAGVRALLYDVLQNSAPAA